MEFQQHSILNKAKTEHNGQLEKRDTISDVPWKNFFLDSTLIIFIFKSSIV